VTASTRERAAAWLVIALMLGASLWLLLGAAGRIHREPRLTDQTVCCAVEYEEAP
jgi:hypothetical protein